MNEGFVEMPLLRIHEIMKWIKTNLEDGQANPPRVQKKLNFKIGLGEGHRIEQ